MTHESSDPQVSYEEIELAEASKASGAAFNPSIPKPGQASPKKPVAPVKRLFQKVWFYLNQKVIERSMISEQANQNDNGSTQADELEQGEKFFLASSSFEDMDWWPGLTDVDRINILNAPLEDRARLLASKYSRDPIETMPRSEKNPTFPSWMTLSCRRIRPSFCLFE